MAKTRMIISMLIFGTLGIFVHYIPLPSASIVMVRAVVGTIFVAGLMTVTRQKLNASAVKQNVVLLLGSGIALGFNWMLLFESYRYTTVAVATLCYYMAPVFLMLLSPLVLKEPMTKRKAACICIAIVGAVLVSGAGTGGVSVKGVVLGLAAAMLYCAIMLMNKKLVGLGSMETTLIQLAVSALVITPYVFLTGSVGEITLNILPLLAVVGVLHTGIAYALYFPSINALPGQTVAVLSYIDPISAILLSALVLRQPMSGLQALGATLLLGATFVSEWKSGKKEG